jgi:hypothetical protein
MEKSRRHRMHDRNTPQGAEHPKTGPGRGYERVSIEKGKLF